MANYLTPGLPGAPMGIPDDAGDALRRFAAGVGPIAPPLHERVEQLKANRVDSSGTTPPGGQAIYVNRAVLEKAAKSMDNSVDAALMCLPNKWMEPPGGDPRSAGAANGFNRRGWELVNESFTELTGLQGMARFIRAAASKYDYIDDEGASIIGGGGRAPREVVSAMTPLGECSSPLNPQPPPDFFTPDEKEYTDAIVFAESLTKGAKTASATDFAESLVRFCDEVHNKLAPDLSRDALSVREYWKPAGTLQAETIVSTSGHLLEIEAQMRKLAKSVLDVVAAFELVKHDHPTAKQLSETRDLYHEMRNRPDVNAAERDIAVQDYENTIARATTARTTYERRVNVEVWDDVIIAKLDPAPADSRS
ncbi:hypothetical protein [Nocardia yamanashiensis]|uniref:hypothetical protein n=1 Tax=Nocardia yamanashiensis TaxID=209247 RepID=UPI0012FD7F26|nr:hypothetical protein [Nocardia yamanashiensis]